MNKADEIIVKLNNFEDKLLGEYYSEEEYKEMLFTAGLSEREYQTLQASLKDYISRAKQFAKRGLNEDALKEYKSAQIISPNDFEVNLGLANCYFNFWIKTRESSFRKIAEKHTQFCLNLKPNDDSAADLFEQIRNGKRNSDKKIKPETTLMKKLFNWLMEKDKKGEHNRLYSTIAITLLAGIVLFYVVPVSIMDSISAKEAQKISVELEKKYELINKYILDEEIEKAQEELINLVHPSNEKSEIYPKGIFVLEPYTYNEYWKTKREELSKKIEYLKRKKEIK
jgi:hypothetical protein